MQQSSISQDVEDRFLRWSPIQLWSPSPPLICLNSSNIPLCQPHPPQHFVNANEAICKVYVNRLFGKNLMKREIQILRWVYCREIWCQTYFPSQQMFFKKWQQWLEPIINVLCGDIWSDVHFMNNSLESPVLDSRSSKCRSLDFWHIPNLFVSN